MQDIKSHIKSDNKRSMAGRPDPAARDYALLPSQGDGGSVDDVKALAPPLRKSAPPASDPATHKIFQEYQERQRQLLADSDAAYNIESSFDSRDVLDKTGQPVVDKQKQPIKKLYFQRDATQAEPLEKRTPPDQYPLLIAYNTTLRVLGTLRGVSHVLASLGGSANDIKILRDKFHQFEKSIKNELDNPKHRRRIDSRNKKIGGGILLLLVGAINWGVALFIAQGTVAVAPFIIGLLFFAGGGWLLSESMKTSKEYQADPHRLQKALLPLEEGYNLELLLVLKKHGLLKGADGKKGIDHKPKEMGKLLSWCRYLAGSLDPAPIVETTMALPSVEGDGKAAKKFYVETCYPATRKTDEQLRELEAAIPEGNVALNGPSNFFKALPRHLQTVVKAFRPQLLDDNCGMSPQMRLAIPHGLKQAFVVKREMRAAGASGHHLWSSRAGTMAYVGKGEEKKLGFKRKWKQTGKWRAAFFAAVLVDGALIALAAVISVAALLWITSSLMVFMVVAHALHVRSQKHPQAYDSIQSAASENLKQLKDNIDLIIQQQSPGSPEVGQQKQVHIKVLNTNTHDKNRQDLMVKMMKAAVDGTDDSFSNAPVNAQGRTADIDSPYLVSPLKQDGSVQDSRPSGIIKRAFQAIGRVLKAIFVPSSRALQAAQIGLNASDSSTGDTLVVNHDTCASGMDRTGVQALLTSYLWLLRQGYHSEESQKEILKILVAAGHNPTMAHILCVGSPGLKSDSRIGKFLQKYAKHMFLKSAKTNKTVHLYGSQLKKMKKKGQTMGWILTAVLLVTPLILTFTFFRGVWDPIWLAATTLSGLGAGLVVAIGGIFVLAGLVTLFKKKIAGEDLLTGIAITLVVLAAFFSAVAIAGAMTGQSSNYFFTVVWGSLVSALPALVAPVLSLALIGITALLIGRKIGGEVGKDNAQTSFISQVQDPHLFAEPARVAIAGMGHEAILSSHPGLAPQAERSLSPDSAPESGPRVTNDLSLLEGDKENKRGAPSKPDNTGGAARVSRGRTMSGSSAASAATGVSGGGESDSESDTSDDGFGVSFIAKR